ncbi:hypothetical protein [Brevundimonas fluminis]|jgi:hypothetical protein|uniref:hypothetical protein n=1 Tax=Brevundimonas fluminis TaxID=2487274 RepID=UPI000F657EF3|nr:hypothetical protein [Brevundimonas fluminis]
MSPIRLSLLGLAALSVAACASVEPAGPLPTDASAPQPLAGHDWFGATDEGMAHLTYGRAESDDVWLTLSCAAGSGRLALTQYTGPDDGTRIALESGGETESWPATREPDEMNGGVYLTAQADADTPVFQRFRRVGWLAAYGDGWREAMVVQPGSAPRVERFFAACG